MILFQVLQFKPESIGLVESYRVRITIDDFSTICIVPVEYWSIDEYIKQWHEGLERIRTHDISCIITGLEEGEAFAGFDYMPLLKWFVLYKKNNKVIMQKLYFAEEKYKKYVGENILITRENCYDYIPSYKTYYQRFSEIKDLFFEMPEKKFFQSNIISIEDTKKAVGSITINTYTRKFELPIDYWSINDYKEQWQQAIDYLKHNNSAYFISKIYEACGTLERWLLYKRDGKIIIHYDYFSGMHYRDEIGDVAITLDNWYQFIPPEEEHLKKYKVDEWEFDVSDFDDLEIEFIEKG